MAWPPATIPASKANTTDQQDDHPGHHNLLANAMNDTVAKVQDIDATMPRRGAWNLTLATNTVALPRTVNQTDVTVFSVPAGSSPIVNPTGLDRLDLWGTVHATKLNSGTPVFMTYWCQLLPGPITGPTALIRYNSTTDVIAVPFQASATGLAAQSGPFAFQIIATAGGSSAVPFDIQGGARIALQWCFS